jgi:hypothetical protein
LPTAATVRAVPASEMINDVETRLAPRIVDAADIEQHRETLALEAFEGGTQVSRGYANDAGVGNVRPNGRRVEGSAPGRGSLGTWHR